MDKKLSCMDQIKPKFTDGIRVRDDSIIRISQFPLKRQDFLGQGMCQMCEVGVRQLRAKFHSNGSGQC